MIVTPAPAGSLAGNRVTAERWRRLLAAAGHQVTVAETWNGEPCDALLALHARKSFPSIERWRRERPNGPLAVVLTGTDLYGDLGTSSEARHALELADRLVALQPRAADELPDALRGKVRVIHQSAEPPRRREPRADLFEVCLLAHLRPVKDPLRAARAADLLPPGSRVRILHAGESLDEELAAEARSRSEAPGSRYRWLGPLARSEALELLAGSRLLLVTSRMEGGANVVSEALAAGVPVLSTEIPGSVGMLGEDYPGYFPVGDAPALAALLARAESDPAFLADLAERCGRVAAIASPARERAALEALLAELADG